MSQHEPTHLSLRHLRPVIEGDRNEEALTATGTSRRQDHDVVVDDGLRYRGHDATHRARRLPAQRSGVYRSHRLGARWASGEGFGYGVLFELYNYGDGGYSPYRFTLQPTVFLTTGGRRDFTLFFDAPHLLPEGWRIDASLGSERQIASPYYGLGNTSVYDELLEDTEGQYYYRFGRTRRQAAVNVQRRLGDTPVRVLAGVGVTHTDVDPLPKDATGTLLSEVIGAAGTPGSIPETIPGGWSNHLRVGLVWDTRDRETGPNRGTWSEILVQAVPEFLGSESGYVRWTLTDRRYVPLGDGLTFANRFLVQDVAGKAPFYDLYIVQTSLKQREGLGGGRTLRGILKNRYDRFFGTPSCGGVRWTSPW